MKLLIDCDPGIDDTFALLCAARYATITAVTTVSGNVSVDHTTRNALHALELAGVDAPVHRGAERPLRIEPAFASRVHGTSGLGNRPTPTPARSESDVAALDALLAHSHTDRPVIVALGPLTNIAHAIRADPGVTERITHLHWMGGSSTRGNVTPFAEFNAWADPHAAAVVMESGVPLTMYGLDLTHQVRLGDSDIAQLREAATPSSIELADFLDFYQANGSRDGLGQPMHDPCAVIGATHPDLFDVSPSRIVVTVDGDERGQTSINDSDPNDSHQRAVTADAEAVRQRILDAATDPSPPSSVESS